MSTSERQWELVPFLGIAKWNVLDPCQFCIVAQPKISIVIDSKPARRDVTRN